MNLYYRIWVDLIVRTRSIPANKNNWKQGTLMFMTMAMAINLAIVMTVIEKNVEFVSYDIEIDTFLGRKVNSLISGFLLFIFPNLLVNYVLIFRNERYKKLVKKYKSYNGKLFFAYFFTSLALPIIIFIIGKLL